MGGDGVDQQGSFIIIISIISIIIKKEVRSVIILSICSVPRPFSSSVASFIIDHLLPVTQS